MRGCMTFGMFLSAFVIFLGLAGTCSIVAAPIGIPGVVIGALGLIAFAIGRAAFR